MAERNVQWWADVHAASNVGLLKYFCTLTSTYTFPVHWTRRLLHWLHEEIIPEQPTLLWRGFQ